MTKPFRFGVQATTASSGAEWFDLCRRVEDLGYSTLFLTDHYLGPGPAARSSNLPPQHLAPLSAMAAAAAVTQTLRIGCRVFCVDYHLAAALVKEVSTIELLSDGRLELGLGAGIQEAEYDALGLPFAPGRDRVDKLEEVVALAKQHWSGEPIDLEGDHVRVSGYRGLPAPVQRPRPPIMIGGKRPRLLRLAAREADIVSISNVAFVARNEAGRSPRDEMVHRYRTASDAAGERLGELEFEAAPYFTMVTDRPDQAHHRIAGWIDADPALMADHPNVLAGPVEAIVERLIRNREDYGTNYVTFPQASFEACAPIVERLTGA